MAKRKNRKPGKEPPMLRGKWTSPARVAWQAKRHLSGGPLAVAVSLVWNLAVVLILAMKWIAIGMHAGMTMTQERARKERVARDRAMAAVVAKPGDQPRDSKGRWDSWPLTAMR